MKVRFGPFVLDAGARALLRGAGPLHLSPKAFDVLEILVARRPNVVSKETLLAGVWPDKVVEEANLAIVVGEIRKALGDDTKSPSVIVTVPRRGYRFAADAEDLDARAPSRAEGYARCWLAWNDKTLPLHEGENVVGRHPASGLWINAPSVSRSHARITINAERARVEDLGSRNGTFVDGRQISGPHLLVDGSTVTFGSERATFRAWSDEAALGTEPVRR